MLDPDLEIKRGARLSRPLDKGGGAGSHKNFSALGASVWSKHKGGGGPPGPSPGSATDLFVAGRSFWNVEKRERPPGGEGDKSSMQKGTLVFSEATAKSISFLLTVHFITVNQVFRQDRRNVCSGLCYNKVKQFLK